MGSNRSCDDLDRQPAIVIMNYADFKQVVWDYYLDFGRDLPWRDARADGSFDPYKIMVSEIMLQQTQATRVIPKYLSFIKRFPTPKALAKAPLADVLAEWSGLGYNRRAKFLWQAANQLRGSFPDTPEELVTLPGVGVNTAVFIETNIRTIYIHHFFADRIDVDDKELIPFIKATLDHEQPREWYWALMDYGAFLKASVGNTSRNSKHYTKQSTFKGSKRQIRGQVIRILTDGPLTLKDLELQITDKRLVSVIDDLLDESLIQQHGTILSL